MDYGAWAPLLRGRQVDMTTILWIRGVLQRRFARAAGAIVGVALSVALIAAISLFLAGASRSMTARAVASVPIDWQVQLVPGADAEGVSDAIGQAAPIEAGLH